MKKSTPIAITILSMFISGTANSQGVPVSDPALFSQSIAQVEQLKENYYQQLKQLQAIIGSRDISNTLNNPEYISKRIINNTIRELQEAAIFDDDSLEELSDEITIINNLKVLYETPELLTLIESPIQLDRRIAIQMADGLSAMAASSINFEKTGDGIDRVETIIKKIDETPDIKASIDLNTLAIAEAVSVLHEQQQNLSLIVKLLGAQALEEASRLNSAREFRRRGQ